MCFISSPNPPPITAAPTPQSVAKEQEAAVTNALDRERRARRAAAGRKSTILTGPMGSPAPSSPGAKTLLGA